MLLGIFKSGRLNYFDFKSRIRLWQCVKVPPPAVFKSKDHFENRQIIQDQRKSRLLHISMSEGGMMAMW